MTGRAQDGARNAVQDTRHSERLTINQEPGKLDRLRLALEGRQ